MKSLPLPLLLLYLMLKVQHCYAPGNIDSYPFDLIETSVLKTIQNHNERKVGERNTITKIDKEGATERERKKEKKEERKKRRKRGRRKER
jgi:hypothetical protein